MLKKKDSLLLLLIAFLCLNKAKGANYFISNDTTAKIISLKYTPHAARMLVFSTDRDAIIRVDTTKITSVATRFCTPGVYKVKAWRRGGVLFEKDIVLKSDSTSLLKIRIKDTEEFAKYKSDYHYYRIKAFLPKKILIGYSISMPVCYLMNYYIGKSTLKKITKEKELYDSSISAQDINSHSKKLNNYIVEYNFQRQTQNALISSLAIIPIGIIIMKILKKNAVEPIFKEVPLLSHLNFDIKSAQNNGWACSMFYKL